MEKFIDRVCRKHGNTSYVLESSGYYRCKKCRSDAVTKRRQNVKIKLIEYFGGGCQSCSYNRCVSALEFHHVDSNEKEFSISKTGSTISFARAIAETKKCVLVCSICHREIHAGMRECPSLLNL